MLSVRDRLNEHITADRVKLEAKRSVRSLVVLLIGIGVMIAGGSYILAQVAPTIVSPSTTVRFAVANADAVKGNLNEIRIHGIPAGRITGVKLVEGRPVISAEIKNEFAPVYKDMQAELRPGSALEDMYLDVVDRGTRAAGEADPEEPLSVTQTDTPVNINDILAVFNGSTRARMRALLAHLGNGLEDRGAQLRLVFRDAIPLVQVAGRISRQLSSRRFLTKRLVHNTAVLTTELAQRERQLRTLVTDGSATLSTLQDGAGDLDATLRALPPTLEAVDSSFTATRAVLDDVDRAVQRLHPVAARLGPALGALRDLSADGTPAVAALQQPVRQLVPLARTLVPLSGSLRSAVTRLRREVPLLDRTTTNLVRCEDGVKGFFHYDASMTKFADSRGIVPRGNLVMGLQTTGFASPEEYAPQSCTDGQPITGRPPTPEDAH